MMRPRTANPTPCHSFQATKVELNKMTFKVKVKVECHRNLITSRDTVTHILPTYINLWSVVFSVIVQTHKHTDGLE